MNFGFYEGIIWRRRLNMFLELAGILIEEHKLSEYCTSNSSDKIWLVDLNKVSFYEFQIILIYNRAEDHPKLFHEAVGGGLC